MIKVIVAGGRDFKDAQLMETKLDKILSNYNRDEIVIISGRAKGADRVGEEYAQRNSIPVEEYPAQWDLYGTSAGYIRNTEMANNATHLVCFWDGKSRGTKNMIDIAKKRGLPTRVILYNQ